MIGFALLILIIVKRQVNTMNNNIIEVIQIIVILPHIIIVIDVLLNVNIQTTTIMDNNTYVQIIEIAIMVLDLHILQEHIILLNV